jgi:hypothetical protein
VPAARAAAEVAAVPFTYSLVVVGFGAPKIVVIVCGCEAAAAWFSFGGAPQQKEAAAIWLSAAAL